MDRVLQSHRLGPHKVDVVAGRDDDGSEYVVVVIDGTAVTDPPLESVPDVDGLMSIYATWQGRRGGPGR